MDNETLGRKLFENVWQLGGGHGTQVKRINESMQFHMQLLSVTGQGSTQKTWSLEDVVVKSENHRFAAKMCQLGRRPQGPALPASVCHA